MLTRQKLTEMFHELRDRRVLSVYVDADQRDPAQRDAWRVRLDGDVARLRRTLEKEGNGGVAAFDEAWGRIADAVMADAADGLAARAWVAFATPDRLWHAGAVPAHMPPMVTWQQGIHAAPYVRALKQERPVTVVLVDGRRARVFEQVGGQITELEGILADTSVGDLSDVGVRKGSARTSGMRGETGTDQARRLLEVAAERLRKEVADLVDARVGDDGLLVVGGPSEAARALVATLPRRLQGRVAERQSLHLDMTPAQVREEIRLAAGDLSEAAHLGLVAEVADAARAGGRGALGLEDATKALEEKRVDTLLLSRSFIQAHPPTADHAVGLAFGQGADVEELSGEAGARLDAEAGGIAARLRYPL